MEFGFQCSSNYGMINRAEAEVKIKAEVEVKVEGSANGYGDEARFVKRLSRSAFSL